MRVVSSVAVAAVVALSSTACTSAANKAASTAGCDTASPGSASNAIKVSGDIGKQQQVTIPSSVKAGPLQRTVVVKGSGPTTKKGDQAEVMVSAYVSSRSEPAQQSQTLTIKVGDSRYNQLLRVGISCVPVGSRSVVTESGKELYGDAGNPQAGIAADDTVVIVVDVLSIKPPLKPAVWTNNPPSVTFDDSGKPTLTLPSGTPDPNLEMVTLREGTGATVQDGDSVTVDYQGTNWNTGKIFDQSYGQAPRSFVTDQVVKGFGAALVGQKVGARLVVTMPPELGYGVAGSSSHELAGQTLVFVIEIKATKSN